MQIPNHPEQDDQDPDKWLVKMINWVDGWWDAQEVLGQVTALLLCPTYTIQSVEGARGQPRSLS